MNVFAHVTWFLYWLGKLLMTVCQKCGDEGVLQNFIYCAQCKVSAEHRYCLDTLPKSKKEKVVWTCEECTPTDNKIGAVPSRKSERISQAAEVRVSTKMRKLISFLRHKTQVHVESLPKTKLSGHDSQVHVDSLPETKLPRHESQVHVDSLPETKLSRHESQVHVDSLPEIKQSGGDCLFSSEEFNRVPFSDETLGNQELRKKKRRRLLLEDEDNSDEESKQIKAEASQLVPTAICDGPLNTSCNFLPFESGNYVHSQPTIVPIWRGCFNINNLKGQTSVGLVAHLTSNTCSKVIHTATVLPLLVNVEILAKSDVWPQRFQISSPTDDNVALYFFPEYESDEKAFDSILDDMIGHNLALKAVIKDQVLLVFSSRELPLDHWRVCRKYYWWGVLEPINNSVQSGGSECPATSKVKRFQHE